ncbi:MAG: TatD DNase family protein, partial [Cellvibrionaceae bacterium]
PWRLNSLEGKVLDSAQLTQLEYYLSQEKCVAVGECGLDALIESGLDKQQAIFEQQIQIACKLELPLIIHVRKTHNETLKLLSHYRPKAGGVIHGFTGSVDLAQRYWSLGFYLGIGGSITYPRANKTRKTVKGMPLESLLLETDAPDMPLSGFQGEPNSPLRLPDIAHALAELRQDTFESICHVTTENSRQLFML